MKEKYKENKVINEKPEVNFRKGAMKQAKVLMTEPEGFYILTKK